MGESGGGKAGPVPKKYGQVENLPTYFPGIEQAEVLTSHESKLHSKMCLGEIHTKMLN